MSSDIGIAQPISDRSRDRAGTSDLRPRTLADATLKWAGRTWFVVMALGQFAFLAYLLAVYGGAAWLGDWPRWNQTMPHAYVAGDAAGNGVAVIHILFAAFITLAGIVQLVPQIRARFPVFHRWTGRTYLVAVVLASAGGLYLLWGRGTVGGVSTQIGMSVNALLIWLCAFMALQHARARDFTQHRRWALRLFLCANAVWFFRVILMFWIMVNRGPVGFDPHTLEGPFITFLAFAQYLLPLALLEVYLRAQDVRGVARKLAAAGTVFVGTLAMGVGVFAAAAFMWWPRM